MFLLTLNNLKTNRRHIHLAWGLLLPKPTNRTESDLKRWSLVSETTFHMFIIHQINVILEHYSESDCVFFINVFAFCNLLAHKHNFQQRGLAHQPNAATPANKLRSQSTGRQSNRSALWGDVTDRWGGKKTKASSETSDLKQPAHKKALCWIFIRCSFVPFSSFFIAIKKNNSPRVRFGPVKEFERVNV